MSEDTTIHTSLLSYFGLEIGIFTLISLFAAFFVLKSIKGNPQNLEFFFAKKKWPFLSSDRSFTRYTNLLTIGTLTFIIIPIISLIIWGSLVSSLADDGVISKVPGVSIFLIGFAVIFFVIAILYVQWSYFKIKIISLVFVSFAMIFYFAFQIYALLEQQTPSFLGVSAVFLSINAIIMVTIAMMSHSNPKCSILDILDQLKQTNNKEEAIDTKYNNLSLDEQYEKLLGDSDYEVTEKELKKYISIVSDKKEFNYSILSGGLQSVFRNKSLWLKRIILCSLYALSIGVLIAYAVIVENRLPEKYLGYITAVAVITTDIIIFFITQLKISHGQTTLSFLIVGMRSFLFGFGGDYWFLGYCSLYLLLGLVIGWKMVERYFPLELNLAKKKVSEPFYQRILQTPLFTYGIINIVFIIIVAIIASVDSSSIPKELFSVLGKEYELWVFGIASILINFTILAILATFRLHQRRLSGLKDKIKFPFFSKWFSTYLVFAYCTYGFAILCGILWYVIVEDIFVLLTALIIPPVILAVYVLYINYKKNEYKIIADIKTWNTKTQSIIDSHANAKKSQTLKPEQKEEVDIVDLKEDKKKELEQENELPEFLNFSGSAGTKKLIIYEDWRANKLSFFQAFLKKKLLPSDYRIIFSSKIKNILILKPFSPIYHGSFNCLCRGRLCMLRR